MADLEGSSNGELDELWLEEAHRRFQELKDGSVQGIPASQVFARLKRTRRNFRTGKARLSGWLRRST